MEDYNLEAKQFGISTNSDTAFLVSVANENFTVEEYPSREFGVNDLDGCYTFSLKDRIFFCAEKNVYGYNPTKQKWIKIAKRMDVVRYGAASVSLKEGAIVAGGKESDGKGIPELTDSCVLLRQEKNKLSVIKLNKLPMKVRYHTMTKISDEAFIMCGGMNSKGHEANEVFLGILSRTSHSDVEKLFLNDPELFPPRFRHEWRNKSQDSTKDKTTKNVGMAFQPFCHVHK